MFFKYPLNTLLFIPPKYATVSLYSVVLLVKTEKFFVKNLFSFLKTKKLKTNSQRFGCGYKHASSGPKLK